MNAHSSIRAQILAPLAPRMIDEDMAAAYCGISKTMFRAQWRKGIKPKPEREGRRLVWDVRLLDRYLDARSGIAAASNSWDD